MYEQHNEEHSDDLWNGLTRLEPDPLLNEGYPGSYYAESVDKVAFSWWFNSFFSYDLLVCKKQSILFRAQLAFTICIPTTLIETSLELKRLFWSILGPANGCKNKMILSRNRICCMDLRLRRRRLQILITLHLLVSMNLRLLLVRNDFTIAGSMQLLMTCRLTC